MTTTDKKVKLSLTDRQIHILKHALGISFEPKGKIPHRNRFIANRSEDPTSDCMQWEDLVTKGLAISMKMSAPEYQGFIVTREGAKLVGITKKLFDTNKGFN